jgi:predicted house-cleaning noncanonical NTP pyrophosphatase (MazG superfamily)
VRKTYDKLVRDRIPEIIGADGGRCETTIMDDEEYRAALLTKLMEEAKEAASAGTDELVTELADLLEVIESTIAAHGLSRRDVEEERQRRRRERGSFEQRLRLLWAES